MFVRLGNYVSRYWPILLVCWIVAPFILWRTAPKWDEVVTQGEFAFLPEDSASLQGERLFREAFPSDLLRSAAVVVVTRERHPEGLLPADREFIETELKPRLEELVRIFLRKHLDQDPKALFSCYRESGENENLPEPRSESPVRTFADKDIGRLLESEDKKASLVVVELSTEFLDARNRHLIGPTPENDGENNIEALIGRNGIYQQEDEDGKPIVPPGLSLALSGSATVGRDMLKAGAESSDATERWTVLLVVFLLVVIYRAPILALIPLATVGISSYISLRILSILADHEIIELFAGIEVYVRVLTYGAGVDYCLFLIARYREELDEGASHDEGIANSLGKVGAALTASAGTVMCGIGMMVFAQFGKFQQAGIGITLSLAVVLVAALTFTPSLLRLFGRWAFWPKVPSERVSKTAGWLSPTSLFSRVLDQHVFSIAWSRIGDSLKRRPGAIWLISIACMLPFAVAGAAFYGNLSYGLLSELPEDSPSVIGANAVQEHFPAGVGGEATLLLESDELDFTTRPDIVDGVTQLIMDRRERLHVADVRSSTRPLGRIEVTDNPGIRRGALFRYYVSSVEGIKGDVTRIDVVFQDDPFSRNSIRQLDVLERSVRSSLLGQIFGVVFDPQQGTRVESVMDFSPAEAAELQTGDRIVSIDGKPVRDESDIRRVLEQAEDDGLFLLDIQRKGASKTQSVKLEPFEDWRAIRDIELFVVGPTASIRDLKRVTDSDQLRIDVLVLTGVYLILVVLLRRPAVCLYLIVSVFFSYFVTIGVTFAVFWSLNPAEFAGLDWKVPMFLFTILIAVGEDYNIFLMTRIEEEQRKHGLVEGVAVALRKTGSIISSCGFIMAGTFSSLLIGGTLVGMQQLGFALAFGVLLDTFVVRPILVPAYLIMLHQGRFGRWGRYLGANEPVARQSVDEDAS